jgi:hypothetical protein
LDIHPSLGLLGGFMNRRHRTSAAVLLACLLLGSTAACSDKAPPPGGGHTSSTSKKHERPAPYAASLEYADIGSSGGQAPTPAPGEPVLVTVTNRGTKADTFLLQLRPPDNGGVSPGGVVLKPGASAQVRVVMLPAQPGQGSQVSLVAISRATKQQVGSLDLVPPKAE